jgi:neutral ceramidase
MHGIASPTPERSPRPSRVQTDTQRNGADGSGSRPRHGWSSGPRLVNARTLYSSMGLCLIALLAAGGVAVSPAAAGDLRAGLAQVDVTPPVGYRMSGYFFERFNTGVRDPLYAKVLACDDGDDRWALVVCDLIGINRAVTDRVRALAHARFGYRPDQVAVAATHSHTGPLYSGPMREWFHAQAIARHGDDPHEVIDYVEFVSDQIVAAIGMARDRQEPSLVRVGNGTEAGLSYNRRFHMRDGTVRCNPGLQNPDIVRAAGPIDPEIGLIWLQSRETQQPLGALSVFALHLDCVGGTRYSGDYPAVMQVALQQKYGPGFVSVFGAGTCGDLNHVDTSVKTVRSHVQIGQQLAESVIRGLESLPADGATPRIAATIRRVELPLMEFSAESVAEARNSLDRIGQPAVPFLDQVDIYRRVARGKFEGPTLGVDVQVLQLSEDTAIVLLPGEVFVELGLAIKERSPYSRTLVIELANDSILYVPTQKACVEGSYETVCSYVAPGAGELLVEAAVTELQTIRGRFKP